MLSVKICGCLIPFGGEYRGRLNSQDDIRIEVPVQQAVVKSLGDNQFFVDTGSPHLIIFKKPDKNWIQEAYQCRWKERFKVTRDAM